MLEDFILYPWEEALWQRVEGLSGPLDVHVYGPAHHSVSDIPDGPRYKGTENTLPHWADLV